MLGLLTHHRVRTGIAVLFAVFTSFALGTAVYLARVRAMATALINSTLEILTTADAEREIAAWRERSGKDFWKESEYSGGDHYYDALISNLAIARLRVIEPTGVKASIAVRDGKLRCITVIESTGWSADALVQIQEWFDVGMPNRFHVGQSHRPHGASVEFPSFLSHDERAKAFAVNTNCLLRPGGCKSAEDILPGVWQLESVHSPD